VAGKRPASDRLSRHGGSRNCVYTGSFRARGRDQRPSSLTVVGDNRDMSKPLALRAQVLQLIGRGAWLGPCATFLALGCGDAGKGNELPPLGGGRSNTGGVTAPGGSQPAGGTASATGGARPGSGGVSSGSAASGGKATGGTGTGGTPAGGTRTGGTNAGGTSAGGPTGGMSSGGASIGGQAAGSTTTGGAKATGGATATGGTSVGGAATGGTAAGGSTATGGSTTTGGTSAAGGSAAMAGSSSTGGGSSVAGCATPVAVNRNPFNCNFAWGSGNSSASSYLNFITAWIGYETNGGLSSWSATATNNSCNGCTLAGNLASSTTIPAFYAYTAAYQGHVALSHGWSSDLPDCNVGGPPNLCTDGAAFILANYDIIINAYAQYAKAVYNAAPTKAAIWLIEGDISQYTNSGQQVAPGPMTWAQLGKFAGDITCAIKSNQPSAMVYVNHSYWLSTSTTTAMFNAMPNSILDGLWMGGSPATAYLVPSNTAVTYSWLHTLTGLPLYVGGQGASQPNWVSATATDLNSRISDGVIAADIDPMPSNAQTLIAGFATTLNSTCP
jgi:hypothetical protein